MRAEVIARVGEALVCLRAERRGAADAAAGGHSEHLGSAVVVSRNGHALTVAHLVRHAHALWWRGPAGATGQREPRRASVVACDAAHELALLRLADAPQPLRPIEPPPRAPLPLGAEVAFMGLPYADVFDPPLVMTMRAMIANRYRLGTLAYDVLDAEAAEGMSGGPVFCPRTGRLLGIVASRFDPARARARLGGASAHTLARLPAERTNITFCVGSAPVRALLARHGLLPRSA